MEREAELKAFPTFLTGPSTKGLERSWLKGLTNNSDQTVAEK